MQQQQQQQQPALVFHHFMSADSSAQGHRYEDHDKERLPFGNAQSCSIERTMQNAHTNLPSSHAAWLIAAHPCTDRAPLQLQPTNWSSLHSWKTLVQHAARQPCSCHCHAMQAYLFDLLRFWTHIGLGVHQMHCMVMQAQTVECLCRS
jgi:hypothetical protein